MAVKDKGIMLLEQVFYGNTLLSWFTATCIFLGTFVVLTVLRRFLAARIKARAERTHNSVLHQLAVLISRTGLPTIAVVGLFAASYFLDLPSTLQAKILLGFITLVIIQLGVWASSLTSFGITVYTNRYSNHDPASSSAIGLLSFVGRFLVWLIAGLLILDNLGINVKALVTGLGIGGIAIALAVQNILSDLLASLSIVLDKPFEVGDFIIVGDSMGTVEQIGIKTTRLRSLSGEQLVFSNSDLLGSRIRNYKRMYERRVVYGVGVTYQTSSEQLRLIPEMLKQAALSHGDVRFDRSHFKQFASSSLDFEMVYFVLSSDFNRHMDILQAINLTVFEEFTKQQIEFAYPTQTLFLQSDALNATELSCRI